MPPKAKGGKLPAAEPGRKGTEADPEQYERFLEAARELGCEDNPERLNEVLRRMAKMPPQRRGPTKADKGKKAGS